MGNKNSHMKSVRNCNESSLLVIQNILFSYIRVTSSLKIPTILQEICCKIHQKNPSQGTIYMLQNLPILLIHVNY